MHYSFLFTAVVLLVGSLYQVAFAAKDTKSVDAIVVNSKGEKVGTATLKRLEKGVKIELAAWSLPPGKHAIHIHENADDDQTQPSGDSGARIACAEIKL